MNQAETLIDKAKELGYTQEKLAKAIGVKQQDIAKLKAGKRTLTPELAAKLGYAVHVDPLEEAKKAMIAADLANPEGGLLAEILGKAGATGEAVVLPTSYKDSSISATKTRAKRVNSLHIVLSTLWRGFGALSAGPVMRKRLPPASGSPFVFQ